MLWKKMLQNKRKAHSSPHLRPDDLTRSEWTADILQVHHRNHDTTDNRLSNLVESREGISLRPSLLDPYVRLSPHTAPDILSFCFASCV
ncbi:MAG: HNH endonuclease [Pleurocapsa minor HA4230-MV1]|nr:HNH endonuclease [Pleurocapsa minor HA4230-MV1]